LIKNEEIEELAPQQESIEIIEDYKPTSFEMLVEQPPLEVLATASNGL